MSKKNSCVDIKNIKGNISNNVIGEFRRVKKYGIKKFALVFFLLYSMVMSMRRTLKN